MKFKQLAHNTIGHFMTITHHRHLVMFSCFECGLYKQGLLHDLSKYSFEEFSNGVIYYQEGKRSPIDGEIKERGFSYAQLHHFGRNKHHWKYWTTVDSNGQITAIKMPLNYFLESLLDRIAACKNYQKDAYSDASPYIFFNNSIEKELMHIEDAERYEYWLKYLMKNGEKRPLKKSKVFIMNLRCRNINRNINSIR